MAPSKRMAATKLGDRRGNRDLREAGPELEVASVTVMSAEEEPVVSTITAIVTRTSCAMPMRPRPALAARPS